VAGVAEQASAHPLFTGQVVAIGRDPQQCQIVLDSPRYGMVSRRHAELRPVTVTTTGYPLWEVWDLGSANGTYVNGERVQGSRVLQVGDRLVLGQAGPEFSFEGETSSVPLGAAFPDPISVSPLPLNPTIPDPQLLPIGNPGQPARLAPLDGVTLSQLLPILSTGGDLRRKGFLVPGILTVIFVVLMFVTVGSPGAFNLVLACYLAGAAYFFVYQLCGKSKPWWVLFGAGLMTMIVIITPLFYLFELVFRRILPGDVFGLPDNAGFLRELVANFFGAGMLEELLKALPVFLMCWVGSWFRSPRRERVGVWEPLDGILIGAASAVGFTLLETLAQYVPNVVDKLGEAAGTQLLIPRILGSIAGHMAYSGYFGYFIGLSMMKPSRRWAILGVGYLTASILHALWNSATALNVLLLPVVGVLSYAFLTAAILKARALSPNRAQNFATRIL